MFWGSVIASLKVLTFWETYVAGLEYLAIFFVPMIIVGMIMETEEPGSGLETEEPGSGLAIKHSAE